MFSPPPLILALTASLLVVPSTTSLSTGPSIGGFRTFEFDPITGVCRRPSSFRWIDPASGDGTGEDRLFVMRNTPGDGDCVFHAVLSSVFVSMGMLNPDSALSGTMSSMALEMRGVVAKFLSSPDGTLYVTGRPRKRIVRCRDLLRSAANGEGIAEEEYLARLRRRGREGGLYGGGPELTVLSNVLRRPISIYHLKQVRDAPYDGECVEIERMGVFGEGLFEDPGRSVPDSVVTNAVFFTVDGTRRTTSPLSSPLKCSWHVHILIADAGDGEKHATVLLPSVPILHNDR